MPHVIQFPGNSRIKVIVPFARAASVLAAWPTNNGILHNACGSTWVAAIETVCIHIRHVNTEADVVVFIACIHMDHASMPLMILCEM